MCGERVLNETLSVLLMKGGCHQPGKEDTLSTHVGQCMLPGTMSMQRGIAVQRACLMESMHVCVCVYRLEALPQSWFSVELCDLSLVQTSLNCRRLAMLHVSSSCPFIK